MPFWGTKVDNIKSALVNMLEMQCQSNELDYLPKSIDKMEKLETLKVIFLTILQIKIS